MKHAVALRSLLAAGRYRLTGHRAPLLVWLSITHRCDALCAQCAVPLRKTPELSTQGLVEIIDGLARQGTLRVVITGGEPLLREDLGVIVDRCADHGIFAQLETNGHLYPERAPELDRMGELVVGLDGDEAAHDAAREPGSHARVLRALEVAHSRGIAVRTRTVISRHNAEALEGVIALAERLGHVAEFQLLQASPLVSAPVAGAHASEPARIRAALRGLIDAKVAGRPVANSEKGLRYLSMWPDFDHARLDTPHEDLHCVAGQLFCAIEADGSMNPCPMWAGRFPARNASASLPAAWEAVRDNPCRACTHGALAEYNFLYNLNVHAMLERARALAWPRHGAP